MPGSTMPNPRSLTWLLALLLCWQGVAVAVASPLPAGGQARDAQHHAARHEGMTAQADCAHQPAHCQEVDRSGPHHCGQQCLHCPAPTAGQPAAVVPELVPEPASPPGAVIALAPPHPGFEIYRPPVL
ncbi:MAG: hypothetical protein AMXMBFR26_18290 [Porticoccaceae bacterium]